HRVLPPFPTRRSSDLQPPARAPRKPAPAPPRCAPSADRTVRSGKLRTECSPCCRARHGAIEQEVPESPGFHGCPHVRLQRQSGTDRKSTRLNSSHVEI